MTIFEILTLVIGSGSLLMILKISFGSGKIVGKIDSLMSRVDSIENKLDSIQQDINELKRDVRSLDSRVSRIEGQMNPPYHWEPKVRNQDG